MRRALNLLMEKMAFRYGDGMQNNQVQTTGEGLAV
jgi:hypothetical protein